MNEAVFRTVRQDCEAELEEKRSTFIAAVKRVRSEEEALEFIKARKKMHPDARHTVWAYLLKNGVARYSDDSEPQGTAGMPTLEAIRRAGLEEVCIATTRYFGGILLGAGGLTRAYAGAAHLALSAAGVAEFIPFTEYALDLTYADYQRILIELPRLGARERGAEFSDRVTLTVGVPSLSGEEFCRRLTDLTAGRCLVTERGTGLDTKPVS